MNKGQWSTPISDGAAARRAGGRRRHNTKRRMWKRRFAILQIYAMLEDGAPHGTQQALAERFGVHKAVISRDIAWVEGTGFAGSGLSPLKYSFRRGAVSIEWRNPMPPLAVLIKAAGDCLR
jgi:HTH domain